MRKCNSAQCHIKNTRVETLSGGNIAGEATLIVWIVHVDVQNVISKICEVLIMIML